MTSTELAKTDRLKLDSNRLQLPQLNAR